MDVQMPGTDFYEQFNAERVTVREAVYEARLLANGGWVLFP
jgi:hypothetical protein